MFDYPVGYCGSSNLLLYIDLENITGRFSCLLHVFLAFVQQYSKFSMIAETAQDAIKPMFIFQLHNFWFIK